MNKIIRAFRRDRVQNTDSQLHGLFTSSLQVRYFRKYCLSILRDVGNLQQIKQSITESKRPGSDLNHIFLEGGPR